MSASDRQVVLNCRGREVRLSTLPTGVVAGLRRLEAGGSTLADLLAEIDTDDVVEIATLQFYVEALKRELLIRETLMVDGEPLVSVEPMIAAWRFVPASIDPELPLRLSRFAFGRRVDGEYVVETPLSPVRTVLHGGFAASLIAQLAELKAPIELGMGTRRARAGDVADVLSWLVACGIIERIARNGRDPEDATPTLAQWEFHDLLFHARSRQGTHDYPSGGDYRFLGTLEPQPVVKTAASPAIQLPVPDLARLRQSDAPFTQVLEARHSIRVHGTTPITLQELGEFLYRAARVRSLYRADPAANAHYGVSNRPYPSGGGAYDLELYLIANRCSDLTRAIYHYEPVAHQLEKISDRQDQIDALLRDARISAGQELEPQVLITITSRFQRLSWKYSGIAYATVLKNVGVLYQTMYLVATAMGLAPCALGNGDATLAAEAFGLDYLAESSVGEFTLGAP